MSPLSERGGKQVRQRVTYRRTRRAELPHKFEAARDEVAAKASEGRVRAHGTRHQAIDVDQLFRDLLLRNTHNTLAHWARETQFIGTRRIVKGKVAGFKDSLTAILNDYARTTDLLTKNEVGLNRPIYVLPGVAHKVWRDCHVDETQVANPSACKLPAEARIGRSTA